MSESDYRVTWSRALTSNDSNDVNYVVGNVYDILWAKGEANLETIQKHADEDRGHEIFTFT